MNTEFQVSAIEQCKSKLPEKISMTGLLDPTNKPELEPYVSCMEKLAVKKIGVSADKIKACAAAQE